MEVSAWQRGVVDRETGMRSPPANYLPSRVGPAVIAVIGGTFLLSRDNSVVRTSYKTNWLRYPLNRPWMQRCIACGREVNQKKGRKGGHCDHGKGTR